jgi:DNA-binding response OmpR family regulator
LRTFDKDTPIFFFSGAAYGQDKRDALATGAQAYLTKPAEIEELVREISLLISDAQRSRTVANLVQVPTTGYLGL